VTVSPFSDPQRQIEAKVVATDTSISEERRTFLVRTAVNNSGDRLRPGMSFRVVFTGMGEVRPSVPEEAIVWGGEGAYLWTVRDDKARRVPVTIVSRRAGRVFVDAALTARDTIVVAGVQKIRDGQDVRIVTRTPAPSRTGTIRAGTMQAAPPSPSPASGE
jgi:RND family efflux transporter MFP subunit